ncbi:hypothetical protein ACLB2K_054126 [Fragaria x ananassa]
MFNRRYAFKETKISPETVSKLRLKWKFYAGDHTTATPAIYDNSLYFPSWNGYIYAVRASDGSLIWKKNLLALTGLNTTGFVQAVNTTISRSTPTIAGDRGDLLIFGLYAPAVVVAVERSTGRLIWSTFLDRHPASLITMSGTYYKGSIYIGTSSLEETVSVEKCCTFRGSLAKLDVKTGFILWQTFMLPDNHGNLGQYSGAAIWGSSPSIDVLRKHVYIATGNTYSVPENVSQCQENQNNSTVPTRSYACVEPQNHGNSILALDLDSGNIKWYRQLGGYDEAGPGGTAGGGTWGSATDERRVYTNIANSGASNFTLKPSSKITTSDPVDGWQWTLAVAKSYGQRQIPAMQLRLDQLVWLMVSCLADPQTRKEIYTQWTPKLAKSCGPMSPEQPCLVACL